MVHSNLLHRFERILWDHDESSHVASHAFNSKNVHILSSTAPKHFKGCNLQLATTSIDMYVWPHIISVHTIPSEPR
jgi:hypothetical protein